MDCPSFEDHKLLSASQDGHHRTLTNSRTKEQLLVVLKVYFDGSGKVDDPKSQFVTIDGYAAKEELWSYFESEWRSILEERGDPGFMHMNKALAHQEPFLDWHVDKTDFLIQGLIGLLRELNTNPNFCG